MTIDIVKPEPRTSLDAWLRWMNHIETQLRILGYYGKRVVVREEETSAWELYEGGTHFECLHEWTDTETVENDTLDARGEHTTYTSEVEVCLDCKEAIER